jgi:hypothetical protein
MERIESRETMRKLMFLLFEKLVILLGPEKASPAVAQEQIADHHQYHLVYARLIYLINML